MAPRLPRDIPKADVLRALSKLGFEVQHEREHLSLKSEQVEGRTGRMILPNHKRIKLSTLLTACRQAGINRAEFLAALQD